MKSVHKKQWANAGVAAIGVFMYASVLTAFMLMMSVTNPQILRVSRTAAITLSTFVLMLTLFCRIYGGYRIGEVKCRNIVFSLSVSTVLTDLVTYFQLQIMNVNEANNAHLELFGVDLLLLAGALAIQLLVIVVTVLSANWLYFHYHPPLKCVIIAGSEADMRLMKRKLEKFKSKYQVCDCVSPDHPDIKAIIRRNEAAFLFHVPPEQHRVLIEYCYKHARKLFFDLNIEDMLAQNCDSFLMDDVLMTAYTRKGLSLFQRFVKRTMDIVMSLLGLIITSPVMLVCAVAIKACDGGVVFFRQKRMSRDGELFDIIKFRTMYEHAPNGPERSVTGDDARITPVGRVLRRFRIDELPQLINILKGEMSVVGPRPEMLENIENYMRHMPEFAYRNRVKAGLTGYAQVAGKYNTPPREKLMMDISYIENYSFWLDIKLILKTLTVFFREDATEPFEDGESNEK